jgi:NAD(P)-dependent dehydrogenase (short-subunit alcohol dehydrogenase family)
MRGEKVLWLGLLLDERMLCEPGPGSIFARRTRVKRASPADRLPRRMRFARTDPIMCFREATETDATTSVLITGCSSGIGRATAIHLARRGYSVYATARRPGTIEGLAGHGCRLLRLDVCEEASMREAVASVEAEHGAVGVLVNNAGYGLTGPLEDLSPEDVRRQFETNVFGPLRLAQLALPGMRQQGCGRIVNVSSVGGRITTPGTGAYHASKHALEALSDVLRVEVHGFGIDVILIEPGAIRTRWVETAVRSREDPRDPSGPYVELQRSLAERLRGAHEGVLGLAAGPPEAVARVIEGAIAAPRPRSRYVVPAPSRLFIALGRCLPDRLWDAAMRHTYRLPGRTR